ncbi:hypothetical protein [Mesoplasma lactucae]|uniref:Uncharacterized protein n=1 Tax=Mesoplasma lactucae ATCC 49193 TaxID=81460 RepID=A0A291ISQ2_9MOLU|nr:hypothetical protein [Mesoplasma lactucae]ATG97717.1 hypothetical protein CP520_03195 [Mesoplasma lactucae ATCC 49193]ATZ20508.1 hypothetical protein MLACT_v1c06870 [Mesoplasma lactucae ATCC 49193]MCL8216679.1 hypothetical protein [Mesoplasma lactucae ATCC 49193]
MHNNSKKNKKVVSIADWISLSFGLCGVLFGLLSLFALVDFWSESEATRTKDSTIFTIVTLCVDFISLMSALISFIYGYKIYVSLNKHETDLIKRKLVEHEKKSFQFDMAAFIIGVIGFGCGITSLLTITPFKNDDVSKLVTGFGIIFDFISSLLIVFALSEYHKYTDTKEIAVYLREHVLWRQLKDRLNIPKLMIIPKRKKEKESVSVKVESPNTTMPPAPNADNNQNSTDNNKK